MADNETAEQEEDRADAGSVEDDQSEESQKAEAKQEERDAAKEEMKEIEKDPPAELEDWPDGAAKYETFGGPEGDHSYEEGPETKLGPSSLRHTEGGGVTIEGEEVEDPDKYKGKPIPGGPTDKDAPQDLTTQKIHEDQGRELESEEGEDSKSNSDEKES